MGLHRKQKREIKLARNAGVKPANRVFKLDERARRDEWMLAKLRGGSLPFTPPVMSWLSAKLGKPSRRITPDDVAGLLRAPVASR